MKKLLIKLLLISSLAFLVSAQMKLLLNFKFQAYNFLNKTIPETECSNDLKSLVDDCFAKKLWAITMLDANPKFNSGVFNGNIRMFGDFEQCLSIHNNKINGKFCSIWFEPKKVFSQRSFNLAKMVFNQNLTYKTYKFVENAYKSLIGICIPESCSVTNLDTIWTHIEQKFNLPFHPKITEDSCLVNGQSVSSNPEDYYTFSFFIVILLLVVLSTIYDLYLNSSKKKTNIFTSFSLYTNSKRLLSSHYANGDLSCMHGIRVITMFWIFIGHVLLIKIFSPVANFLVFYKLTMTMQGAFIFAAPFGVDTFFAMSGILVVYVYMKTAEKHKINLVMFYIHRFLRLSPSLLATILIHRSVLKHLAHGPIWLVTLKMVATPCSNNMWPTLLYTSNFEYLNKMCLPQSWYLSVDTQLYLFAPLILYFFQKNPNKTIVGIVFLCIISCIYTAVIVIRRNLGFVIGWQINVEDAVLIYQNTISRMPSWLIGTCFGYLLYNKKTIKIPKKINFVLWTLSLFTIFITVWLHKNSLKEESIVLSFFINVFSRPLWSLAICFIIFSCSIGQGSIINEFLSNKIFIVLSKLVYSTFLIHLIILYIFIMNKRESLHFNIVEIIIEILGYYIVTLFFSAVLCLIFESPVYTMLKRLEKRQDEKIKRN